MSAAVCETCGHITVAYYRSANGVTVHRADCSRRGEASVEWHYPARQFHNDHARVLAEIASIPWLKACSYCMEAAS